MFNFIEPRQTLVSLHFFKKLLIRTVNKVVVFDCKFFHYLPFHTFDIFYLIIIL